MCRRGEDERRGGGKEENKRRGGGEDKDKRRGSSKVEDKRRGGGNDDNRCGRAEDEGRAAARSTKNGVQN